MRAMILAAGYGTRLWPLTADRTKPAIPFLGRPLVGYVAEYLASYGMSEIMVNLHHRPESVREALGDGSRFGVSLSYIDEPVILGTSGALDNARDFLESDTFVVVNGKIVTDIDLSLALETHTRTNALATLVLRANREHERYSVVEEMDGLVTGFGGMPRRPASDNAKGDGIEGGESIESVPLMFTGIQILDPRIFDYIPKKVFSHSTSDVYPKAIANGERIAAHVAEGAWYELSTIQRYLDVSLAMLEREGRDVDVGDGCSISTGADVSNSVIWDNVTIEAGSRVWRAVLGDGVIVRTGETIENAAVVRKELVDGSDAPPKALPGAVIGDNFVVSLS
jgi:NDP-sugar pyrophosphorylase family protein